MSRFFLVVLLLGVTSACAKPGEEYLPEPSVGGHIEYSVELARPFEVIQKGKMVLRTEGRQTIGGKDYFKEVAVFSGIPGFEPIIYYERRTPKGIYAVSSKHMDQPEYLEWPLPLAVGTAWHVDDPDEPGDYKVESIETLELFDRSYEHCMKIVSSAQLTQGVATKTMYLATHLGTVKLIWTLNNVTITWELENYHR